MSTHEIESKVRELRQLQALIEEAQAEAESIRDTIKAAMRVIMDELPEKVADALDLEHLSGDDLPALNRLCRAIAPMKDADMEKLNAVVLMAGTSGTLPLCQLAENLDQFDFVPGVHTPEEYGEYMIRESGHFEYDEHLGGSTNTVSTTNSASRRRTGNSMSAATWPTTARRRWRNCCGTIPRNSTDRNRGRRWEG